MAGFNPDEYFNDRIAADLLYKGDKQGALSKYDEILRASAEKQVALNELSSRLQAQSNSFAGSVIPSDPHGVIGSGLDGLARFGSTSFRMAGEALSTPFVSQLALDQASVPERAVQAYNNKLSNKATPEDLSVLQQDQGNVLGISPQLPVAVNAIKGIANLAAQTFGKPLSNEQAIERQQANIEAIMALKRAGDKSHWVDPTRTTEHHNQIKGAWNNNVNQVEEGGRKILDGDLSGVVDAFAGWGNMGFDAAKAIVTNPVANALLVADQVPQIALGLATGGAGMAVTNAGYAGQHYAEGIQNYRDANNGAMPPEAKRREIAAWAGSLAVAEQAGDSTLLKSVLPKKALASEALDTTTSGFKDSLLNIGKAGGKGFVTEGATEGYQTFAEGQALGKPVTGADIFAGAVSGGIAGGGISSGFRALQEVAGATPEILERLKAQEAEQNAFAERVKTNDVSTLVDSAADTYNPLEAVRVLKGNAQLAETPHEAKVENLKQASSIIAELDNQITVNVLAYDLLTNPESKLAELTTQLPALKEQLANTTPEEAGYAKLRNQVLSAEKAIEVGSSKDSLKALDKDTRVLENQLTEARKINSTLNDEIAKSESKQDSASHFEIAKKAVDLKDTAAVEAAQKSIQILINRSMASADSSSTLSIEQANELALDLRNGLTTPQRDYLRAFSKSRIKQNELQTISSVKSEIYNGSPATPTRERQLGIADYKRDLDSAFVAGDQNFASKRLEMLERFAAGHSDKATVVAAAWADAVKHRRSVQVVMDGGKWRIVKPSEPRFSKSEMTANAGYTAHPDSQESRRIAETIPVEAAALRAVYAEKKAAYGLRFDIAPAVTPVAQTPAAPVASIQEIVTTTLKNTTRNNRLTGIVADPVAQDLLGNKSLPAALNLLSAEGLTSVAGVLGSGAGSIVLDTNLGALRMGVGPLENPVVSPNVNQVIKSGVVNGIRYEVFPKADTSNITDKDVADMTASLAAEGLVFSDPGTDNLGRVNGKLVVIDSGSISKAKVAETTATSVGEAVAPVAGVVEAAAPINQLKENLNVTQAIEAKQAETQGSETTAEQSPTISNTVEPVIEEDADLSDLRNAIQQELDLDLNIKNLGDDIAKTTGDLKEVQKSKKKIKSVSLWSALKHSLSEKDLSEIFSSDKKRYNLLKNKNAKPDSNVLLAMVSSGDLDLFLPPSLSADMQKANGTEEEAYQAIVEKLKAQNYLTDEANNALKEVGLSIEQLEDHLDYLTEELKNAFFAKDGQTSETTDSTRDAEKDTDTAAKEADGDTASSNTEEATEASTEEVKEKTPKPDAPGTLGLFAKFQEKLEGTANEFYRKINLVAQYLKQTKLVDGAKTQKALLEVKDFLTTWHTSKDTNFIQSLLGKIELTPEQLRVLKNFKDTVYGVQKDGQIYGGWITGLTEAFSKRIVLDDAGYKAWQESQKAAKAATTEQGKRVVARDKGSELVTPDSYSMKDMMQYLYQEDSAKADTEENVKAAIMVAAYQWIVDAKGGLKFKNREELLDMHQHQKNVRITREGYKALSEMTTFKDTAIHSMGKSIVQALGITNRGDDTPMNLLPMLESALGSHALALLQREGLVTLEVRNVEVINSYFYTVKNGETQAAKALPENVTERSTVQYVKLVNDPKDGNFALGEQIKTANQGSKDVIGDLFGLEKSTRMPSKEASKFSQKTTKGTDQKVPKLQQEVLDEIQQIPHKAIEKMYDMVQTLGKEYVLEIMGYNRVDEKEQYISNRKGYKSKNDSLERQFDMVMELLDTEGVDSEFFVKAVVWMNNRGGFADQTMNLQTSKLSRFLFARPSWNVDIKIKNKKHMEEFLVCVAMALGSKTDQQPNKQTIAQEFQESTALNPDQSAYIFKTPSSTDKHIESIGFKNPAIMRAVAAIQQNLKQKGSISDGDKEAIAEVTKGEGMVALQALVSYAQYLNAVEDGKDSFNTTMLTGADGKTNGPMLTLLALGAAGFRMLNMGGMYSMLKGQANHFSEYYQQKGAMDLYQSFGMDVLRNIYNNSDLKSFLPMIEKITGALDDGEKVTKAMRNMVKTPITAFFFGSSLANSVSGMQDDFIDMYGAKLEKLKQKHKKINNQEEADAFAQEFQDTINSWNELIRVGNDTARLISVKDIDTALNTFLTMSQERALRKAFDEIIGKTVKKTLETKFQVLIARRDAVNSVIQASYDIYAVAYEQAKAAKIKELMASGVLPFVEKKDGLYPLRDLNFAEDEQVKKSIKHLLPVVHTSYSLLEKNKKAGIMMAKSGLDKGEGDSYNSTAAIDFGGDTNVAEMRSTAEVYGMTSPGVAGIPYLTHALDSSNMHYAMKEVKESLNNHDEISHGVAHIAKAARAINKATVDMLLEYSPAREALKTLGFSIMGLAQSVAKGTIAPETARTILQAWADNHNDRNPNNRVTWRTVGKRLLTNATHHAYNGDKQRLSNIAEMKVMDQYTWEGGSYVVSERVHKTAKKYLSELENKINPDLLASLNAIIEAASSVEAAPTEVSSAVTADDRGETTDVIDKLENTKQLGLNGVEVAVAANDLKEQLPQVAEALQQNQNVVETINDMNGADKAEAIQELSQASEKAKAKSTPFGELGKSGVESDPRLLALFNDDFPLSAHLALKWLEANTANPFYKKMASALKAIAQKQNSDILIKMVTKDSKESDVLALPTNDARGWFIAAKQAGNERKEIYVLSPDYKHSGLTEELVLHEIFHAVLGGVIERAKNNPIKNDPAKKLVNELEALMDKAKTLVGKTKKFLPAVSDIHEFISWGMTNQDFQKEILMKLEVDKRGAFQNKLLNGMALFITKVTGLLFGTLNPTEKDVGGMSYFVSSVTGLMNDASLNGMDYVVEQNRSMASTTGTRYSTTDLFEALAPKVSSEFATSLKGLLSDIVEKIHGPNGTFKESVMKDTSKDALSIFVDSLYSGNAPFASELFVSNLKISDQEAFVAQQVEAAVSTALNHVGGPTWTVRRELTELYEEMKAKIKPANFYKGDYSKATTFEKEVAQKQWNAIFNNVQLSADGKSNHLAKFAALGLGHEQFSNMLKVPTTKAEPVFKDKTALGVMKRLFGKILNAINDRITRTFKGQQADEKLKSLMQTLVQIEGKRVEALNRNDLSWMDKLDDLLTEKRDGVRKNLHTFVNSGWGKQNKNLYVSTAAHIVDTYASPGRVKALFENIDYLRNEHNAGLQGVSAGIFNEMKGYKEFLQKLLRTSKQHQSLRQNIKEMTNSSVLATFAEDGTYLSDEQKSAVTAVLVRSGAHVLMDDFDMAGLAKLTSSEQDLNQAISSYEAKLGKFKSEYSKFFINQANALGYELVTGKVTIEWLLRNASNIAHMYGSPFEGKLTPAEHAEATEVIDKLASLYALKYSSVNDKNLVNEVFTKENAREKDNNGLKAVLLTHKDLDKQSLERLFKDSPALMIKGYTSEIYNQHTKIETATKEEGQHLVMQGYRLESAVPRDPLDPYGETKYMYVLRDGGLAPWLSGIMSMTSMKSKGSKHHSTKNDRMTSFMTYLKSGGMQQLHTMTNFDPTKVTTTYTVPVLNAMGQGVNFAYLMQTDTKDNLLERDNRFDSVLGAHASSIFDKEATPKQNRVAVEKLYEEFQSEYVKQPKAFLEVSAESPDEELRNIYRMLPQSTKDAIKEVWGSDKMLVRSDAINITFGYRKWSVSTIFDKAEEDRNYLENAFVWFTERVLKQYGKVRLNMNDDEAEMYSKQGAIKIRRAENVWQALVKEVKDILIVKSGITLLGNEISNKTLLWLYKVPVKDILMNTKIAWEAGEEYLRKNRELFTLQAHLDRGYLIGNTADIEAEIASLKDELARNPVKPLIDSGLMPSIVEDLADQEDIYSRKSQFVKDTEALVRKVNPHVRDVAKQLYMAKDTTSYRTMSHLTQLSDFTARYVLYQHLINRKEETMTHEEAIQEASEAFVNYDIPMHKTLQYMDDMGFILFTKYFLRIQKIIRDRFIEAPGRFAALVTAQGYFSELDSVVNSSMFTRIGNNPLTTGAFNYPFVLDDLLPIKAITGIFK